MTTPEPIPYQCTKCGKTHEGLPDLAFLSPIYFYQMPEGAREQPAVLTSDTCVIDNEYFFVRGVLKIPLKRW